MKGLVMVERDHGGNDKDSLFELAQTLQKLTNFFKYF
jgi:hypothetical protein